MSGFLTRAESRALRMTAENGECALEFLNIYPPHTCGCRAVQMLLLICDI